MRHLALLSLLILAAGCAQKQARQYAPVDPGPSPICRNESECSQMWAVATQQVQQITRMKVAVATDAYLQTFTSPTAPRMLGQVYKISNADGTKTIKGTFTCPRGCNGLESSAERLFNTMVRPIGYSIPSLSPGASNSAASTPAKSKEQQIYELQQRNLPYEQYQQEYRKVMGQ